jgi:hypothetical protein
MMYFQQRVIGTRKSISVYEVVHQTCITEEVILPLDRLRKPIHGLAAKNSK